jgi:monofunctional biosynthetic peptidoglycan transglycosylase
MRRLVVLLAALAALAAAAWVLIITVSAGLPPVGDLTRTAPGETSLMRARAREAREHGQPVRVEKRWVPYERISPLLRRAVLIAEDDAFYDHGGLDWNEMRASARANIGRGRVIRGGSTITQQLAKNLYLGEERTITRKLKEALLAVRLERALDKRRIFELYLNLIEWGPGVYGAEAAARHWFGRSAPALTPREAALLAAIIINPRKFSPLDPPQRIERRTKMILDRMHRRGFLTEVQYAEALGLPPPSPSPAAAESSLAGAPSDSVTPPGSTSAPPEPAIETAPAPTPPDTVPVSPPAAP